MNSGALSVTSVRACEEGHHVDSLSDLQLDREPIAVYRQQLLLAMPQDTPTKAVIAHARSVLQTSSNPDIHRHLLDLMFYEQTIRLAQQSGEPYLFPAVRYILGNPMIRHTLGSLNANQLVASASDALMHAGSEQERLSRTVRALLELKVSPKASIKELDVGAVGTLIAALLGYSLHRSPGTDPNTALSRFAVGSSIQIFLKRCGLSALDLPALPGVYCPRSIIKYVMGADHD